VGSPTVILSLVKILCSFPKKTKNSENFRNVKLHWLP
jgi:hypothetical protein